MVVKVQKFLNAACTEKTNKVLCNYSFILNYLKIITVKTVKKIVLFWNFTNNKVQN